MKFKNWIEDYQFDQRELIQNLWNQTFKALLLGGNKVDEVRRTLKDISGGSENQKGTADKIVERLESVIPKLKSISPSFSKQVDQALSWIGQDTNTGPDKKVSDLLKIMFGNDLFERLINSQELPEPESPEPEQQLPADNQNPTNPDFNMAPQNVPAMNPVNPEVPQQPFTSWHKWKGDLLN